MKASGSAAAKPQQARPKPALPAPRPHPKLQAQLSLLSDYACIEETSYDDLYTEDGWKRVKFRRYRQASGLSPLDFLRQYNQLLELQQLRLRAEERLGARRSLQNCAQAMHDSLVKAADELSVSGKLPAGQQQDTAGHRLVLDKCAEILRRLNSAEQQLVLADKAEYQQQQEDLEAAYQFAFKKCFAGVPVRSD